MRHLPFLFITFLAVAVSASVAAQDYAIKLTRLTKAGAKYRLDARGSLREQQTIVSGGKTNQAVRANSIMFSGLARVLETDAGGHEIKSAITIEKCVKTTGQSELDLLPAGKTLIATSTNGQTAFALADGSTLLPRDADLLRLVIPIYNGGTDEDSLFGSVEQRRPGSLWPINAAAVARDMQQRKMALKQEDVHGATKFVGVTNAAGREYLELRTEMQIINVAPPLPPATRMIRSEVSASFGGLFPVDPTRGRLSDSARWTIRLAFEGPVGPKKLETAVDSVEERESERRFTHMDE